MNRRAFLLFCALGLAGIAAAAPPVEIVSAEFGLFDESRPGEFTFEATDVVPHREGQRYGWIIGLRTSQRSVAVREEYILPTPATEAGTRMNAAGDRLHIPLPRRNQVSQRQLVPVAGRIYGEWAIGSGEPPGRRHLQVIVEGEVAGSFEYEVK